VDRIQKQNLTPGGVRDNFRHAVATVSRTLAHRPGIRWRVVLLALLIPLVGASGWFIWQDYHVRHEAIVTEVWQESALVNAELEKFVNTVKGIAELRAFTWARRNPPAPADPADLDTQISGLQAFVDNQPYFSRGVINDSTGLITVATEPSLIGGRIGAEELYQQAYSNGSFTVSDVIVPFGDDTPFVLFVQSIRWSADKPQGFVVLQTELTVISAVLDFSVGFPKSVKAGIFDSQGRLLAGAGQEEPHPGLMLGKDISHTEVWAKAKTHPSTEWFGKGLDDEDRIIFFGYPEFTSWITTVGYAQSESFNPLWARLWTFGAVLVISVAATMWVGEALIRRERRLVIELEEGVEKRTAELSQANQALKNEIAERAKVEDALRKSEEQQRALITAIPDLILQIKEDGSVLSVKSTDALQLPADSASGNQIGQILPSGVGQLYLEYIQQALQTGKVQLFEHDFPVDNEVHSCEVRLVVSGEGEVVAIVRDITERKRLEEQFLLFHKMDSVGRLAGGVAHEFNNLLAVVMGFSALALENSSSNSMTHSYVQEIQKAGERAANLTRQLLTFSRKKNSEIRPFDLNGLIIDTGRLLRPIIGENIELVVLPTENLRPVKADRSQIEQVLVNLATNARDAMPQGGKLVIKTTSFNLERPDATQHLGLLPGEYAALTFTDTGTGMTDEVKAHVFEPFFTTKEVGKGTGLGLAACYGIMSQSGGYIEVDSAPEQGSTFTVYLPCADAELSSISPENGLAYPDVARVSETVLLVEDEPLVRNLASHVLRKQGYTVLEASNGIDALSTAQEPSCPKIDLVLTDVVMPQMGGKELVRRLQDMFPHVRVLFMSGYAEEFMSYRDSLNPEVGFLEKPFMPNTLVAKIREVLDRV
jgi:two-component system, cell cycle sensor histidine kinase and response regulator CckA